MADLYPFRQGIREALLSLLDHCQKQFPLGECLRVDLHCHDHNSHVTEELLGRILRIPETWLPTDQLLQTLLWNSVDVVTVTNHNNAQSCWNLLDAGKDVLVGAEFSCTLPDAELGVHVLTYGFTPAQEERLSDLRKNLYRFLDFTSDNDLPTILAHPLHFYCPKGAPPLEMFDTLGILFERFEVINGQRDAWQNVLTSTWIETLTEEKLHAIARRTGLKPGTFCRNPYRKVLCGGSDDHMGVFAGSTGSLLHVPDLPSQRAARRGSELALEALRAGKVVPFGSYDEGERLALAFLDYFCQVAINMKDPGLVRMFLHRGSGKDKVIALAIANAIMELRRHRYTMKFLTAFHESLSGKGQGLVNGLLVSRSLKPAVQKINKIAALRRACPAEWNPGVCELIPELFHNLNLLLRERVERNLGLVGAPAFNAAVGSKQVVQRFELPSHLRVLFGQGGSTDEDEITSVNIGNLFDGLSFPALSSFLIAGSAFASNKVLYRNRPFLDKLAGELGKHQHPRRILWLTDTLDDNNGVSKALRSILKQVQIRDLPIDFLICNDQTLPEDHLTVLAPVAEFRVPFYRSQAIRTPDLLELQRVFRQGGYDRIVCSTEAAMGLLALLLKQAFRVPAFFYLHTDWLDFADKTLGLGKHGRDRIRRLLRAFYRCFDGLLVLNSEQMEWLAGSSMGIPRERLFATAHWAEACFTPRTCQKSAVLEGVWHDEPVLLFAGRISEEKGVLQLKGIHERVRLYAPGVKLVIAGTGPAEVHLKSALPDALFLGWVEQDRLAEIYSVSDMLLLPSKFDTFGCVVLEAMSCGLPVIAYNTKGPRDLIQDGINGFLAETDAEFADKVVRYLKDEQLRRDMSRAAIESSIKYRPDQILRRLLEDLRVHDCDANGALENVNGNLEELNEPGVTPLNAGSSFLSELLELVHTD